MKPDLIFANSPFGKPGVEITKYIMENFPDANYAMLNTRTAFKKYYDKLACQYATIGKYLLGTVKVAVIPEDFTETDVIDWQNTHLAENKTETQGYNKNRMKEYRKDKKMVNNVLQKSDRT